MAEWRIVEVIGRDCGYFVIQRRGFLWIWWSKFTTVAPLRHVIVRARRMAERDKRRVVWRLDQDAEGKDGDDGK